MNYQQFKETVKDWPVSNHFYHSMRIALTTGNKATFKNLDDVERKFLDKYGYELDENKLEVQV